VRPIESLLFALAAFAATGPASPVLADPHDDHRDRSPPRHDHESRYARVARVWYDIERRRAAIERDHARDVAEAEHRHARDRARHGEPDPRELHTALGELDARRDDALLALEREQYALADEDEEDD
jgi:hypothetical protein